MQQKSKFFDLIYFQVRKKLYLSFYKIYERSENKKFNKFELSQSINPSNNISEFGKNEVSYNVADYQCSSDSDDSIQSISLNNKDLLKIPSQKYLENQQKKKIRSRKKFEQKQFLDIGSNEQDNIFDQSIDSDYGLNFDQDNKEECKRKSIQINFDIGRFNFQENFQFKNVKKQPSVLLNTNFNQSPFSFRKITRSNNLAKTKHQYQIENCFVLIQIKQLEIKRRQQFLHQKEVIEEGCNQLEEVISRKILVSFKQVFQKSDYLEIKSTEIFENLEQVVLNNKQYVIDAIRSYSNLQGFIQKLKEIKKQEKKSNLIKELKNAKFLFSNFKKIKRKTVNLFHNLENSILMKYMEGFQLIFHFKFLSPQDQKENFLKKEFYQKQKTNKTAENFGNYFQTKQVQEKIDMSHNFSISVDQDNYYQYMEEEQHDQSISQQNSINQSSTMFNKMNEMIENHKDKIDQYCPQNQSISNTEEEYSLSKSSNYYKQYESSIKNFKKTSENIMEEIKYDEEQQYSSRDNIYKDYLEKIKSSKRINNTNNSRQNLEIEISYEEEIENPRVSHQTKKKLLSNRGSRTLEIENEINTQKQSDQEDNISDQFSSEDEKELNDIKQNRQRINELLLKTAKKLEKQKFKQKKEKDLNQYVQTLKKDFKDNLKTEQLQNLLQIFQKIQTGEQVENDQLEMFLKSTQKIQNFQEENISSEEEQNEFNQYYQNKMKQLDDNNLFQILTISKEFVLFFKNWLERVLFNFKKILLIIKRDG